MASGRFQETRGRWEITPTTSVEKVILSDGTNLQTALNTLRAEFATNQEILDIWRLSDREPFIPVSP